jgi:hypothetical protein
VRDRAAAGENLADRCPRPQNRPQELLQTLGKVVVATPLGDCRLLHRNCSSEQGACRPSASRRGAAPPPRHCR